jgi:uncharacterized membrane protein
LVLLVLIVVVVGLILWYVRVHSTGLAAAPDADGLDRRGKVTLVDLQIAILSTAKDVRADVHRIGTAASTDSAGGLAAMLQEGAFDAYLARLGELTAEHLVAVELIWQPDNDVEAVDRDEWLAAYPRIVAIA